MSTRSIDKLIPVKQQNIIIIQDGRASPPTYHVTREALVLDFSLVFLRPPDASRGEGDLYLLSMTWRNMRGMSGRRLNNTKIQLLPRGISSRNGFYTLPYSRSTESVHIGLWELEAIIKEVAISLLSDSVSIRLFIIDVGSALNLNIEDGAS